MPNRPGDGRLGGLDEVVQAGHAEQGVVNAFASPPTISLMPPCDIGPVSTHADRADGTALYTPVGRADR